MDGSGQSAHLPQQVGMRYAILSACWGAVTQVMVRDSSLIVIFAALVGAGEVVGVLSTGLLDLALCLLMLLSLALGSGMLSDSWSIGTIVFSRYHSLFLIFGIGTAMAMLLLIQVPGLIHRVETLPTTN